MTDVYESRMFVYSEVAKLLRKNPQKLGTEHERIMIELADFLDHEVSKTQAIMRELDGRQNSDARDIA